MSGDLTAWLGHYCESTGMWPASVITSVFGAFAVTFTLIFCWPRLVRDLGVMGGWLASAAIVGTFWIVNHKLPGFGIAPDGIKDPAGGLKQYGLIFQGFKGQSPWVDMGWAIAMGFFVYGLARAPRERRMALAGEALPRVFWVLAGGVFGGAICGLVGWTGAELFH